MGVEAAAGSPYPGLRPFQPTDAEYFFGREAQVRDVVDRLRSSRFVAVIGGSGSGKSSLVLAGAIPRLRSFGIDDAGDFWVPIIATPGTNLQLADSPLRRLALKFCAELVPGADDETRLQECTAMLRQPDGLGRLVDTYGQDLQDADEADLQQVKVNYLFLVDQFEELFHPSNAVDRVARDCQHLVQRIVEQFKDPHPQICLAITMRSEHLNDCPRYADLPDAINAASYLVKRLNGEQLRQAIERPALCYLRARMAEDEATAWPESIPFDDELVERLLVDSDKLIQQSEHADHLPLLQHLLFWIWSCALERCRPAPVPDRLTLADLAAAVHPASLDTALNTLEACLERRCEAIFASQPQRAAAWQAMFRHLAFKDPNTGSYTQQRETMAALCRRMAIDPPGDEPLHEQLLPWLAPHPYLHWDRDSHSVKVAHETLIRRWQRMRAWIDEEDTAFQRYRSLIFVCTTWVKSGKPNKSLASGALLRSYEDARLLQALQDKDRTARFARLLGMTREGPAETEVAALAASFLQRSLTYEARSRSAVKMGKLALALLVVVLCAAGVITMISRADSELSAKERALHRGYALAAETNVAFDAQFKDFDQAQLPLRNALMGVYYFSGGQRQETGLAADTLYRGLFEERLESMRNAELIGTLRTVAALRKVMIGTAWRVASANALAPQLQACPGLRWDDRVLDTMKIEVEGAQFLARPGEDRAARSGLLFGNSKANGITVYLARRDEAGTCHIAYQLTQFPANAGARVGVAQDLSNLVVAFDYPVDYTQFITVRWWGPNGVHTEPRSSIAERVPIAEGVSVLPSVRRSFATDVEIARDDQALRLFDVEPTPLPPAQRESGTAMVPAPAGGLCDAFAKSSRSEAAEAAQVFVAQYDAITYCLRVRGRQEPKRSYSATLYGFADIAAAQDPQKHVPLVGDIELGSEKPAAFLFGGEAGWLAFRGEHGPWRAMPWSSRELVRLASEVLKPGIADQRSKEMLAYRQPYNLIVSNAEPPPPSDETLLERLSDTPQRKPLSVAADQEPRKLAER